MPAAIEPQPHPFHRTKTVPWIVVGLWLLGSAYAFWSFELRNQRSFAGPEVSFFDSDAHSAEAEAWFRTIVAANGTNIGATAATSTAGRAPLATRATVVHVSRGDCACNRFTEPHFDRIAKTYRDRGVQFVRASAPLPAWVDATPAALVFDGHGRLVFFGPYSDSAMCGVSGGLVERTLDQVLKGTTPRPQRMFTRGCYCGSENP